MLLLACSIGGLFKWRQCALGVRSNLVTCLSFSHCLFLYHLLSLTFHCFYSICSATSTRSNARTFSIWLAIIATDEPAKSSPTAILSRFITSEPESPPADMLVVTI